MTESEWARFGNWFNFSKWNRLAFHQTDMVWHGAPSFAESERSQVVTPPARFSWHHADAWRDAVLPLAMHWYLPRDDSPGGGERKYLPVQAAAAPIGLL